MKESIYIGIGASAGGLEALKLLLKELPSNLNYVYIIVQHLSHNKKSLLSTLLSNHSEMPVEDANKKCKFLPNHIYVIPANHNLILKNNKLVLETNTNPKHVSVPSIDMA
ncbi:MAG: chemotaxis protein CheB, partial [Sulfurimonas sp.]|nr:chemotaxis protein CheB [Sulfurimonas sp.]